MNHKILLIIICLFSCSCAQKSNFDNSKHFLNNEITFETYISKFDTSKAAVLEFIIESEKSNTNFETRISKGPVEFDSIVDTLLNKYGESPNLKLLEIINSINKSVDGYISESFAVQVASYVEKYPETYKNTIIDQGKDSWILLRFIFDKGIDYNESTIFKNKTKSDTLIFEWAEYQSEKYF